MIFFLIFIFLPLIEISLFIVVGSEIGILSTILLCILAAIAGSFLLRIQGFKTVLAMQAASRRGQMPLQEIFDAFCLSAAGVLLVIPGFFSDILAFVLMAPPLRQALREFLITRYGLREMKTTNDGVIDAEFTRVDVERINNE